MTDEQILYNAVHVPVWTGTCSFCVYNPCNYGFIGEEPRCAEIELPDTGFYRKIKSFTWSCNARYFVIVDRDCVVVGNTVDSNAFLCNPTWRVFEELLNGIKESCKYKSKWNSKT